jgi:hypothetical protein
MPTGSTPCILLSSPALRLNYHRFLDCLLAAKLQLERFHLPFLFSLPFFFFFKKWRIFLRPPV